MGLAYDSICGSYVVSTKKRKIANFHILRLFKHGEKNKKDGYRQLNVRQLCSLRHGDHRGKCYMDRENSMLVKRIAACTYLQPFTRYSEILVGNCNLFIPPFHLTPPYWVAPGTIAVNVTWIEREFNAGQTTRSMHPSIFNHYPVIQAINQKFAILAHFLHILASPGYVLDQ